MTREQCIRRGTAHLRSVARDMYNSPRHERDRQVQPELVRIVGELESLIFGLEHEAELFLHKPKTDPHLLNFMHKQERDR